MYLIGFIDVIGGGLKVYVGFLGICLVCKVEGILGIGIELCGLLGWEIGWWWGFFFVLWRISCYLVRVLWFGLLFLRFFIFKVYVFLGFLFYECVVIKGYFENFLLDMFFFLGDNR